MDYAKEIWEAIRTRFGGNANSKKMQKAVFKQQFEAFKISSSEGLEKGYDKFQQLLSQLEAHGAEVSTEDANHNYEEEMNFSIFNCTEEDSVGKPLYSRFIKTNDFKGVPHPLSGDYTPTPQEEIDESLYVYGKKGPQEPEPSVSDDRSSEYSTCQSNDSEGSIGTSSELSVDSESEISRVPPEVYVSKPITTNEKGVSAPKSKEVEPSCVSHIKTPRQQIKDQETPKVNRKNWNAMMERELGEGYSFTKKKCFVCGSLSHLIKDCDYYEKKMAREAAPKKQRVFNTGNRVAKPVWTNDDRINHANQFVPRPVQLNTGRTNINSVRPRVNTVNSNVNTVRSRQPVPTRTSNSFSPKRPQVNQFNQRRHFSKSYSPVRRPIDRNTAKMSHFNAVKGKRGTAVKTSAGYNWRNSSPNSNCDSGPTFIRTDHPLKNMVDRGIFDSGCSGHMTGNKDQLEDFEEFNGGSVTFGGSKGYITGKGKIRVGNLDFDSVSFVKELGHFNLFSISQICDKQHKINLNIVKGVGVIGWMFDIQYLTDSLNYIPVSLENQANPHAGTSEVTNNAGTLQSPNANDSEEKDEDAELIVVPSAINPKFLVVSEEVGMKSLKKHLGHVPGKQIYNTLSVNSGSDPVNTGELHPDDSPMPELKIFHKSKTGIFYEASYDEEGVVTLQQLTNRNRRYKKDIMAGSTSMLSDIIFGYTKRLTSQQTKMESSYLRDKYVAEILKKFDFVTPKTSHLNAVKRIFNMVASNLDRKSHNGGCQFLGTKTYLMGNARNKTIAGYFTTEDEYVVLQIAFVDKNSMDLQMLKTYLIMVDQVKFWYALTTNPTIYDSLVKQFWQTATAKTLADGTLELHATIDTIAYTITEASIRSKLKLADASGITMLPNNEIFEGMGHMGVVPPTPPTTQPIPSEATTIPPLSQPAPPTPIAETTTASPSPSPSPAHEPMEHTFEQPSSDQQPPTPRQEATISQLMTRINDLEKHLKETKQTFGKAILTLVERVKTFGGCFEEKDQEELVTPSKTVNASGEEQVEDISPTTLEAAAILTKVKKIKSVDKGKRYKRRKSSKEFASTSLDFEEVKSASEKVNTGGIKVNSGIEEEINAG
ncbi:hypothetical protein Tco_0539740 [Tanacetum coccineum]